MNNNSHLTFTTPLLVLAEGTPPGSKRPKACLSFVDCEVSLRVVGRAEASVAYTIGPAFQNSNVGFYESHGVPKNLRQNILSIGDDMFHDIVLPVTDMIEKMGTDPYFRPGQPSGFRERLAAHIVSLKEKSVWPDVVHFHAKKFSLYGFDLHDCLSREETAGVSFTDDGLRQIEAAKRQFVDGLSDLVVVDGMVHARCGEPLFLLTHENSETKVRIWDSAIWAGTERADRHKYHPSSRFFRADREDELLETSAIPDLTIPHIGIVEGSPVPFPLEEMEYFRIAADLIENAKTWMAKTDVLSRLDADTFRTFAELRDALEASDPLTTGVPIALEDKFEAFAANLHRIPKLKDEVRVRPEDLEYARSMWDNRPVSPAFAQSARRPA